jgi:hypothetical protein
VNYRPSHGEAEHRVKGELHCSFPTRTVSVGLPRFALIGSRNIPS